MYVYMCVYIYIYIFRRKIFVCCEDRLGRGAEERKPDDVIRPENETQFAGRTDRLHKRIQKQVLPTVLNGGVGGGMHRPPFTY